MCWELGSLPCNMLASSASVYKGEGGAHTLVLTQASCNIADPNMSMCPWVPMRRFVSNPAVHRQPTNRSRLIIDSTTPATAAFGMSPCDGLRGHLKYLNF